MKALVVAGTLAGCFGAFGEFTIDTTPADPTVAFQLIDDASQVLFSMKLTQNQLTPGSGKAGD